MQPRWVKLSGMNWADYDSGACSVARTVEVLGDRWTLLVLRDIFNGIRRFDELSSHLGVARDVLTKRLASLVDEGLVRRVPYQEPGARTRYEYRLTDAGRDLRPVLLALLAWGDRYRAGTAGPPARSRTPAAGRRYGSRCAARRATRSTPVPASPPRRDLVPAAAQPPDHQLGCLSTSSAAYHKLTA